MKAFVPFNERFLFGFHAVRPRLPGWLISRHREANPGSLVRRVQNVDIAMFASTAVLDLKCLWIFVAKRVSLLRMWRSRQWFKSSKWSDDFTDEASLVRRELEGQGTGELALSDRYASKRSVALLHANQTVPHVRASLVLRWLTGRAGRDSGRVRRPRPLATLSHHRRDFRTGKVRFLLGNTFFVYVKVSLRSFQVLISEGSGTDGRDERSHLYPLEWSARRSPVRRKLALVL